MDLPSWLHSPVLRSDAFLRGLTGEVRDHGDFVSVRSPDNPRYYHGNHLILPERPDVQTLPRWLDRARKALPGVDHACLVWEGGDMAADARDAAVALGADLDHGVGMRMSRPVLAPHPYDVRPLGMDQFSTVAALNLASDPSELSGGEAYASFKLGMRRAWRAWIEGGHATWHGAWSEAGLVGQCGLVPFEGFGRFQSVETHPDHRRRGVCSALIGEVARTALAAGADALVLVADPDGPAQALYQRLGFEPYERLQSLVVGGDDVSVRREQPADAADIASITTAAFESPDEARIIDQLRGTRGVVSLVAVRAGTVLGHLLFSPVSVAAPGGDWSAIALGPMAVRPTHQGQGIGSVLVRAGLDACRAEGHDVCVVLGHPSFYPRFGFVPAAPLGLHCGWDVADEAFMVAELAPGALSGRGGLVRYAAAFDDPI